MAALRRTPVPSRMTVDEFLSWDSGDWSGRLWELVDGEPVSMAPASGNHGAIQGEVGGLIRDHLRTHRPGCRLIVTPGVIPYLRATHNFRIPDLGVACSPPSTEVMVRDPVLLIEIVSSGNRPLAKPGQTGLASSIL